MTMEVQDVPGICALARERGIVTLLDNTWATPLLFPALGAGVDISIQALSKYVGGHSDVMIGSATATTQHFPRVQKTCWDLGHAVSPDDAWLGSRGLRTLGVRLKQHEENALTVAHWLKNRPDVGRVLHPALADCPGHDLWKRDFKGSSGLFSFELKDATAKSRAAFADSLKLFGIGFSWGGYESLVLPVDPVRTVSQAPARNLVRLQIGLEDPDDLIADLDAAFDQAGR
jgi:cystathionine beta-lyase